VWFSACWLFASGKDGISALSLKRTLEDRLIPDRVGNAAPAPISAGAPSRRPRAVPPVPPQVRGHPPSLERPPANRPWRTPDRDSSG
jgi:hypothetical protein